MAPVTDKASPLITSMVTIAGVKVKALIDTGATTSCCRWGWYKRNKANLGPLVQSDTVVFGIGNIPIGIKGMSQTLELEWESVRGPCQLMVLNTLEGVDVILGMDVLRPFYVEIDTNQQLAVPKVRRELCSSLTLTENFKIPAGKSRVFFLDNALKALCYLNQEITCQKN